MVLVGVVIGLWAELRHSFHRAVVDPEPGVRQPTILTLRRQGTPGLWVRVVLKVSPHPWSSYGGGTDICCIIKTVNITSNKWSLLVSVSESCSSFVQWDLFLTY